MGHASAIGMAEFGGVNEATLHWHLTSNHYPPHDPAMVSVALAAIEAVNEEDPDRVIDLPEIITYRGQTEIEAWEAVTALNLEAFLSVGAEGEL